MSGAGVRFDLVVLDGELQPADRARVDPRDRGLTGGEALIETLAVVGGRALLVEEHLERLSRSERELGWEPSDPDRVRAWFDVLVRACGLGDGALRLLRTSGPPGGPPTRLVDLRPLPARPADGAHLVLERGPWARPAGVDGLKHSGRLARSVLRERARARGAHDALLVDRDGQVLEATCANLVVVLGGEARTPPTGWGVLPGVVRGLLLAAGELVEAPVTLGDLERAQEVLLTSSLVGSLPARSVEGRSGPLPGPQGPIARRFAQVLGDRVPTGGRDLG